MRVRNNVDTRYSDTLCIRRPDEGEGAIEYLKLEPEKRKTRNEENKPELN